jgi:RNA polymerase sigma-70 factor (ECF subfamily)
MIDVSVSIPWLNRTISQVVTGLTRARDRSSAAEERGGAAESEWREADEIDQARQGDPDAYQRLIERHQDHVGRILWRFSRDRRVHEELVQDVFVEAYLSLGTFSRKAPFEHWLARIATRVGYRYWKEKARQRQFETFSVEEWDQVSGAEDVLETLEPDRAATLLHALLEQLPPRDRLVLTLRYLEECDVAATARRTGWSKAMVKVQTLRARNKLRKLIEQSSTERLL